MAEKIRFFIMPGSLHDVHQMSTLLIAMQMKARGMHISDYFCMSAANIPDVIPPEGNSEQQRWESEQEDNVSFQARMAIITQTIGAEQHLTPPGGGGGAPTKKGGTMTEIDRPASIAYYEDNYHLSHQAACRAAAEMFGDHAHIATICARAPEIPKLQRDIHTENAYQSARLAFHFAARLN